MLKILKKPTTLFFILFHFLNPHSSNSNGYCTFSGPMDQGEYVIFHAKYAETKVNF